MPKAKFAIWNLYLAHIVAALMSTQCDEIEQKRFTGPAGSSVAL
jgi:hypothetical protein